MLQAYDVIILVETFLLSEWQTNGHYSINVLAEKGPTGRPKGGIACLFKEQVSPFAVQHKSKNVLVVRTMQCLLICEYFHPYSISTEIIDETSHCLSVTNKENAVILAGDLNCRIDIEMQKTTEVMRYLEEEGLTLINNKKLKTYMSQWHQYNRPFIYKLKI
jgi:hypothetical protein